MAAQNDMPLQVQEAVLDVRNLTTGFYTHEGFAVAADNVSFSLHRGETLGIVGESGCGKSVTALSILQLVKHPGRIVGGQVMFEGENLLSRSDRAMREIRGNRIAMVFQEPMTSLNPVFTIRDQIMEVLLFHESISWDEAYKRTLDILDRVGIPDPKMVLNCYPHQLSGGMRQRVLIAMSLVCTPDILIADEPTTAIDVTVQAQVLELLRELRREYGMAVIMITHDLGVVAETCDRVAIMYASHIVETASVRDIFRHPRHPYTIGLLQSIPSSHRPKERLTIIPGQVPRPTHYPAGCNFHSRCKYSSETCVLHEPVLKQVANGHEVSCWNHQAVEPFRGPTAATGQPSGASY
jgi:oligopeptide/dipeptide ABC transporter ATP-binding protein